VIESSTTEVTRVVTAKEKDIDKVIG